MNKISNNGIYFTNTEFKHHYVIVAFTPNLVRHECRDGASYLVVVHAGGRWAQQDKQEPDRNRHLQHRLQLHRLLQSHECHGGLLQEVHAAWKTTRHLSQH